MKPNRHLRLPLCVPGLFARCVVPGERNLQNKDFVEAVSEAHARLTMERIHELSPILRQLENTGEIQIAGCIYDLDTGRVRFLPQ